MMRITKFSRRQTSLTVTTDSKKDSAACQPFARSGSS